MDLRKLLIADPSDVFGPALSDMLGGLCDTRICFTGPQALTCLEEFRPDVLVTELVLPGIDGISFLEKVRSLPDRPAVVVVTTFVSEYIGKTLGALDVDYVMQKPCDLAALRDRILDFCMEPGTKDHHLTAPESAVTNLLLEFGLSTRCGGFRCLETAISLYIQDPAISMTKELYPEVARLCGGSGDSVEKAIRTVIHSGWERRDERQWRLFFCQDRSGTVPRPTNAQFIATVAQHLRQQNRCAAG